MQNKNNTIIIVIALLAVALFAYAGLKPKPATAPEKEAIQTEVVGNKDDLVSFSLTPGQEVSGKTQIAGSVRGGYFFEGNILINILDADKNLIRGGYATATTDWMTAEPVSFDTTIDMSDLPKGLTYIEIHNDNASGLPENDKSIMIPIIVK